LGVVCRAALVTEVIYGVRRDGVKRVRHERRLPGAPPTVQDEELTLTASEMRSEPVALGTSVNHYTYDNMIADMI
jgi:hypothetical protein